MAVAEACAGERPLCAGGDVESPPSVEPSHLASWGCPKACLPGLPACCHRGAQTVGVAYSLGRQYCTTDRAKVISLVLVSLLLVCHSASRYYRGSDSCQRLLSTGHFLDNNVWQPDGCKMHSYSSSEAKACLAGKQVTFIGDSRIWHMFISFVRILTATNYTPAWRHVDINYKIRDSTAQVNFLWNPKPDADMTKRLASLTQAKVKPDAVIIGVALWVIVGTKGSAEGLRQYKDNLKSMDGSLETLAQDGDVYWHIQEPVRYSALQPYQKNLTNKMIDLYNEAATEALNIGSSRIKAFEASRRAGFETMAEIADGVHMAPRVRDLAAMVFMNSLCNKLVRPIDGSCCQTTPPLTFLQKMALCVFLGSALLFLILHFLIKKSHRRPTAPDVESLEERKPATAAGPPGAEAVCGALCRMGLIMVYFYLCDRADVFQKEQKHYSHSAFFIPLIMVFVLGLFCSESTKEVRSGFYTGQACLNAVC